MGQRSQIYVRYNDKERKGLIANYYQWNYGERMISRARYGIECILARMEYGSWYFQDKRNRLQLSRILDVNFDMKDVQLSIDIIAEREEYAPEDNFNNYVFFSQDNNDGKLLIDICENVVKYAFLDCAADIENIMDGEAYMCWDDSQKGNWRNNQCLIDHDEVKTCEENIKYISENATLMTKEEVEEFINYDYEAPLF